MLQQRVDGVWTKVAGPALKANVKLLAPASFRIAAGKLAGSVLKVPVAPLLTAATVRAVDRRGTVKPLAPGAPVELQLETEGTWSTVGATTTGVEAEYTLVADQPGALPGPDRACQGFAEGLSGQIELREALVLVLVAAALLAPQAEAARYAVGVASLADLPALRAALPGTESLAPIPRSSSSGRPSRGCATSRARPTSSGSAHVARRSSRTTRSRRGSGTSSTTGRSTSGRRRRPACRSGSP